MGASTAALTSGAISTPVFGHRMQERPNIIYILVDDQGWGDMSMTGATDLSTPNLDTMATEGVFFTNYYNGAAKCAPTRRSLLTGRHERRLDSIALNEVGFISDRFKQTGYATACIGKWGIPYGHPLDQGFDYYFGCTGPNHGMGEPMQGYDVIPESERDFDFPDELVKKYTEETISYINQHTHEPFFLFLSHNLPHDPVVASSDFVGTSDRGIYGDSIQELDWSTGQILQALKDAGIDDNTLVIYHSDNGGGAAGASNAPLRAGKSSIYEGGYRVPCIMRWPGTIPAGTQCHEIACSMDLFPTFIALSGTTVDDDYVRDGRDISGLLSDPENATSPHQFFVYCHPGGAYLRYGIRSKRWKLVMKPDAYYDYRSANYGLELYDLENDWTESTDVKDEHPDIVDTLMQTRLDMIDHMLNEEPIPYDTPIFDDVGVRGIRHTSAGSRLQIHHRSGGTHDDVLVDLGYTAKGSVSVRLADLSGRIIASKSATNTTRIRMRTRTLQPGHYVIIVTGQGHTTHRRLTVR
jgi:arylsulfatase A-like enzyme